MERRLAEQHRRAARERTKAQESHDAEIKRMEARMSKLKGEHKRREAELRGRADAKAKELASKEGEVQQLRQALGRTRSELTAAQEYIKDLVKQQHSLRRAALPLALPGDENAGRSADLDKIELERLKNENSTLSSLVAAKEERLGRERAAVESRGQELEAQHRRIVDLNELLTSSEAETARLTRLLEAERELTSNLRRETSETTDGYRERLAAVSGERNALADQQTLLKRELASIRGDQANRGHGVAVRLLDAMTRANCGRRKACAWARWRLGAVGVVGSGLEAELANAMDGLSVERRKRKAVEEELSKANDAVENGQKQFREVSILLLSSRVAQHLSKAELVRKASTMSLLKARSVEGKVSDQDNDGIKTLTAALQTEQTTAQVALDKAKAAEHELRQANLQVEELSSRLREHEEREMKAMQVEMEGHLPAQDQRTEEVPVIVESPMLQPPPPSASGTLFETATDEASTEMSSPSPACPQIDENSLPCHELSMPAEVSSLHLQAFLDAIAAFACESRREEGDLKGDAIMLDLSTFETALRRLREESTSLAARHRGGELLHRLIGLLSAATAKPLVNSSAAWERVLRPWLESVLTNGSGEVAKMDSASPSADDGGKTAVRMAISRLPGFLNEDTADLVSFLSSRRPLSPDSGVRAVARAFIFESEIESLGLPPGDVCVGGQVLARVESILREREWRIPDLFRRADVLGYGSISLPDLKAAVLRMGYPGSQGREEDRYMSETSHLGGQESSSAVSGYKARPSPLYAHKSSPKHAQTPQASTVRLSTPTVLSSSPSPSKRMGALQPYYDIRRTMTGGSERPGSSSSGQENKEDEAETEDLAYIEQAGLEEEDQELHPDGSEASEGFEELDGQEETDYLSGIGDSVDDEGVLYPRTTKRLPSSPRHSRAGRGNGHVPDVSSSLVAVGESRQRPPDELLPEMVGILRRRLADEVYAVGESLFRVVEADFREPEILAGLKKSFRHRRPKPVDVEQLEHFHRKLTEAAKGSLRWLLLIYLRTYESLRELFERRAEICGSEEEREKWRLSKLDPAPMSPGNTGSPFKSYRASPFDAVEPPEVLSVLEKRITGVLDETRRVWNSHRRSMSSSLAANTAVLGSVGTEDWMMDQSTMTQSPEKGRRGVTGKGSQDDPAAWTYLPGDKAGYLMSCRHIRTRKGCAHCTQKANQERKRRLALGFIDDGAGPKEFWQNINPKKTDTFRTKGKTSAEKLEAHMWRLVLLVRCQDRKKGLRLARHESQRKLLDMRIYEILLLYMRQQLEEENLIRESEDGNRMIFAPIAGEEFLRHLGKNKDPTLASLNFRPFQALSASVKAMGAAPGPAPGKFSMSARKNKRSGRGYSTAIAPVLSQLRKTG